MDLTVSETVKSSCALGPSVSRVIDIVQSKIAQFYAENKVSDQGVRFLELCFAQSVCPQINYDEYAIDFAYAYFIQNYWKCSLTYLSHQPHIAHRVLDAGCGSGAAGLAYLTYLNDYVSGMTEIQVCFLDKSSAQLAIAKDFLEVARPLLSKLNIKSEFRHVDILEWQQTLGLYDLILHGHVLTENRSHVSLILKNMLEAVAEDGRIYAIEREHDSIWLDIEAAVGNIPAERTIANTRHLFTPIILESSDLSLGSNLVTAYLVIRDAECKKLRKLIDLYFRAWQYKDSNLLQDIFTPDATYSEKPFSAPLVGINEIKRYWVEKVSCQQAISMHLGHISYTSNEAVAEWRAHFYLNGTPVDVRGAMILTLDQHTKKIKSLREYFRTQHG